jgi:hypothetical protein
LSDDYTYRSDFHALNEFHFAALSLVADSIPVDYSSLVFWRS